MGFVKAPRTGKQDESNTGEALTLFSGGCRWPLRPTAFPQTVIPQPVLLPGICNGKEESSGDKAGTGTGEHSRAHTR